MRIAVFGGAYSNPYALQALLADAARRGCQRTYFLGDLGGFGAEPDALWPLLVDGGVHCLAGNYDVAIAAGGDDCGCGYRDALDNEFAALAFEYTKAHTSPSFAAWMGELPTERRERLGGVDVHMVHGSPLGQNDFFWESLSDAEVRRRLDASGADVVLCTHSGLPWIKRIDGRLVVNVGVIGRPANDGAHHVWYGVINLEGGRAEAELVALRYEWRKHAASMRAAGLPEAFVETIETGWWTSCLQVLPPMERSRGRFHLYRSELGPETAGDGLAERADDDGERPVVSLLGTALLPRRLWLSKSVEPRRAEALRSQARALGFVEVGDADDAGQVAGQAGVPQLTFTSSGIYWNPAAIETGLPLGGPDMSVSDAVRLVVERILTERQTDGHLARPVVCA